MLTSGTSSDNIRIRIIYNIFWKWEMRKSPHLVSRLDFPQFMNVVPSQRDKGAKVIIIYFAHSESKQAIMDQGNQFMGPEACSSVNSRPGSRASGKEDEKFAYEHFPVVCQTCMGSGKVPKGRAFVTFTKM